MNILCIDIGNTSISYCHVKDDIIGKLNRILNSDNLLEIFSEKNLNGIDLVLVCSVVPKLTSTIFEYSKLKDLNIHEINYKSNYIKLLVDNPSEVGADRICNIAAIKKIYDSPSIVIDFGTATTYDITSKGGDFIGGAIAPGIDISANYLIEKTALLKETIYQFPKNVIGKNTKENIQSGVMYGGLESVKGMIQLIKNEMNTEPNIIITGGFGEIISKHLDIKHVYIETLTIKGMLDIYHSQSN